MGFCTTLLCEASALGLLVTRRVIDLAALHRFGVFSRESSLVPTRAEALKEDMPQARRANLSQTRSRRTTAWLERTLGAVLDSLPTAAAIVDHRGRVCYVNEAGASFTEEPKSLVVAVRQRGRAGPYDVTRIDVPGYTTHWLVRARAEDPMRRALEAAASDWRLSTRQTAVLERLLCGDANKTIASTLGCTVKTVEAHLTALLRKAGATSRAAVVAQAWAYVAPPAARRSTRQGERAT